MSDPMDVLAPEQRLLRIGRDWRAAGDGATFAVWFAEGMETGMLRINRGLISDPSAPFGGVKQSGIGKEWSHEGILQYVDVTDAAIDLP